MSEIEGWIDDLLFMSATRQDSSFLGLPKSTSFSFPYSLEKRATRSETRGKEKEKEKEEKEKEKEKEREKEREEKGKGKDYAESATIAPQLAGGLGFAPKEEIVEEIRFKNPQSHEEFSVSTALKKDDMGGPMSSFTASWPTADSSATHGFHGYNLPLEIGLEKERKGKKKCDYSQLLNKLFVDRDQGFKLNFQLKDSSLTSFPPGTLMRITPAFMETDSRGSNVKICPVHKVAGGPEHILRCSNDGVSYVDEPGDRSRYSLVFPFTGKKTAKDFKFLCYSSCHELDRKRMELVFTMEVADHVIARTSFEVKICSYPVRDRTTEEAKAKQESNVKEDNSIIPSLKRAPSLVTNPAPTTETADPSKIFNIKVQGYENYRIVSKILQGLDALKALGQELNSGVASLENGGSSRGLKRLGEEEGDEEDRPLKRRRLEQLSNGGEMESQGLMVLTEAQKQVSAWLTELGLSKYLGTFVDAEFADVQLIKELNPADLDSLEIHVAGHRKKLLLAAKSLKRSLDGVTEEVESQSLQGMVSGNTQEGDVVEQIEEFQKRTIMRRYHSGLQ